MQPSFHRWKTEAQRGRVMELGTVSSLLTLVPFLENEVPPGLLSMNRPRTQSPSCDPSAGRCCWQSESARGQDQLGASHFTQFPHLREETYGKHRPGPGPGGPAVEASHFQSRGAGSVPWAGKPRSRIPHGPLEK